MNTLLKYSSILLVFLSACSKYYQPVSTTSSHSELKSVKPDSLINVFIDSYKKEIDGKMNEVIAISDSVLTKDGMESTLANFVLESMDYYIHSTRSQSLQFISFVNRGGLRVNLPIGEITVRNIYELMPFDNEIVIVKISGEKLKQALNSFCDNGKLLSKNISFQCENKLAKSGIFREQTIIDTLKYTVITTDYLANGGDNCYFFSQPFSVETTNVKLRDAIINYCRFLSKTNLHITPYRDGRISVSK